MIELLMVILSISILEAVAVPQFLDFRNDAKSAATRKNLEIIQVASKQWENSCKKPAPVLPCVRSIY